MTDIPASSGSTEQPNTSDKKSSSIKYVLQLAFGSYTYIRTNVDVSIVADRQAVTDAVLTALTEIDLTASEIAELYAIFSLAQLTAVRENAILDNLTGLLDLASELQTDERSAFLAKFTVLSAQAKAREDTAT